MIRWGYQLGSGWLVRMLEYIPAGFPSAAEGYEDEPLNLHQWLVRNPAATFFYRVRGDGLADESIRDGSVLVVDRSIHPSIGKLVVMEDHGEFVVRRFRSLQPVRICGVVVASITKF